MYTVAVRFARDGCATGGGDDATGVNTPRRDGDLLFPSSQYIRTHRGVVIAACRRN